MISRHKQEMKRLREESQGRVACLKSKLREVKASNESMQQEIERLKGLELEVEQQTSRCDRLPLQPLVRGYGCNRGDGLEEDKTRLNGRLEEMEREMESRRRIEKQQGEQIARALHDLNVT